MSAKGRVLLCGVILASGLIAQASLEALATTERPSLRAPLASIPLELGDWVGRDTAVDPDIIERAQTTEYISRDYESKSQPGRHLRLWINYSREGNNLRHSPKICLPSGGWNIVEAECRKIALEFGEGRSIPIMRLGYTQGELVQGIGFWYYIFGEGALEKYVRTLPITSRSSHGRTTRGSSMTVEVFSVGDIDARDTLLKDFSRSLLEALEPILPADRAEYFVP
ncbi:MAG: EpsI family protein [Isosphaeraceae bacterium]|nr:EpsI family protein [Isosphaeraceae bacterium]